MILGKIIGKVTTTNFQFLVTNPKAKKFMFTQISHPEYGFVLAQIMELEQTSDALIGNTNIIGYKDQDQRVKQIRTPFQVGTEVLEAQDEFIKDLITVTQNGAYIGKLEGKDLPIYLDLQKILTRHLAVLAKSGAGKSYTVGCLLEEIMEKNIPLLILDPHGEYSSLSQPSTQNKETLLSWNIKPKSYFIKEFADSKLYPDLHPLKLDEHISANELMQLLPISLSQTQEAMLFSVIRDLEQINFDNILLALQELNSHTKWSIIETITYLRDLRLFSSTPTPLNDLIKPGQCTIINLKGIEPQVQSMIAAKLLKDLFMARKSEKIPPFFCVLEEAHNFCPEKGFGKAKSTPTIRLISSEGRKFGLGLCVISQRPALVQKTVLAQCSTQIIMKITNPNDLRSIQGSVEGITTESLNEIQNLPVGSALICGMVDRPLVVNIRPRRTQHGGHAINILGSQVQIPEQDPAPDIIQETQKHEQKNILNLILPKLTIKDITLMSQKPIKKITTYLIPSTLFSIKYNSQQIAILLDRIKGKIIIDPDSDQKRDITALDLDCAFLRKPAYQSIEFDNKLPQQLSSGQLREQLSEFCEVNDFNECFILFRKVEY